MQKRLQAQPNIPLDLILNQDIELTEIYPFKEKLQPYSIKTTKTKKMPLKREFSVQQA